MVRFSWAVMEIDCVGWLATQLISSLPVDGGREGERENESVESLQVPLPVAIIIL